MRFHQLLVAMARFGSAAALSLLATVGSTGMRAAQAQSPLMLAENAGQSDAGGAMRMHSPMHGNAAPAAAGEATATAGDRRERVSLPASMREHMLANMRDHLATLDKVIGDVADDRFDAASKLLEERLGMSSLSLHHAAEMAPYFPQPMQDAGTSMHRAASRLAIALQEASVKRTFDAMREVDARIHDVTSSCVACHAGYRLH